MKHINIAIVGNGNLGKACKQQILKRPTEFNLVGVFSRRAGDDTIPFDDITYFRKEIDVVLYCGGSNDDAPKFVPHLNKIGLSTVDSYDNHGEIANRSYQNFVATSADKSGTTAVIGAGWDPGYLSLQRIYNKAILPDAMHTTFWGGQSGGMSMGHTNAIKNIPGVLDAHQITLARPDAIDDATQGKLVDKNNRHKRICYVVCKPENQASIERQIRNMEGYFKGQEVEIHFKSPVDDATLFSQGELVKGYEFPYAHGGQIIAVDDNAKINLQLDMKSNPLFTANAMLAFAKANYVMQAKGLAGAFTIDQIPPEYLLDDDVRLGEI